MAVMEKGKRRIYLVCADAVGKIGTKSVKDLTDDRIGADEDVISRDDSVLPGFGKLLAVITASDKRCRDYAVFLSGGKIPVLVSEGIRELTDEEAKSAFTPRRVINAYRSILSSFDGDVAVVAPIGYMKALISFLECRSHEKMGEIEVLPGSVYEILIPGKLCAVIVSDDSNENESYRPMPNDKAPALMDYLLDTLTRVGVSESFIVCGQNKDNLEKAFDGTGRIFLDSKGLSRLLSDGKLSEGSGWDSVFLLSSSFPVFTLFSAQQLLRSMGFEVPFGAAVKPFSDHVPHVSGRRMTVSVTGTATGHAVVNPISASGKISGTVPVYKGKRGYPILIRHSYFLDAMGAASDSSAGKGSRGGKICVNENESSTVWLENIIKNIAVSGNIMEVSVPDPAVVLCAGTHSGCEKVRDHLFALRTPSLAYCRELLQWMDLPKGKLRHSEKVAFYAREMAEEFNSRGRDTYSLLLDENITAAGGMLHDIAKGHRRHASVGAAMLRSLNMDRTAEIVENHQNPAERYFHSTSPVLIVYLADKMFLGDEFVGIEERFRRKRKKHKGDEKALKKLSHKEKRALRAKEVYENSIRGWPVG